MYCTNCGRQLSPGDSFCDNCGTLVKKEDKPASLFENKEGSEGGGSAPPPETKSAPDAPAGDAVPKAPAETAPQPSPQALPKTAPDAAPPETAPDKKKRSRGKTIAIIAVILAILAAAVAGVFFVLSHLEDPKVREFLELGSRYLLEENYEEAILAYESALEIDEKSAEAYLGMADAYIGLGETEKAISVLKDGYRLTEDEAIDTRLKEIRSAVLNAEELKIDIVQVDSADFPEMTVFTQITNPDGKAVDDLPRENFVVTETDERGRKHYQAISEMKQISDTENWSMNMVLDQSGSMSDYDKMDRAMSAAHIFLREITELGKNRVEISSFDDNVYLRREFTDDYDMLANAINALEPTGGTALYDAIYATLLRTSDLATGARCVVVFTDGIENSSGHSYEDVIRLSMLTGIPVYVIGIGRDIDETALRSIADGTGGRYYNANTEDLSEALSGIYMDIYEYQRSMYTVRYKSSFADLRDRLRTVELKSKPTAGYDGLANREYTPNASETVEEEKSEAKDLIIVAPPETTTAPPAFDSVRASSVRKQYKDITYVAANAIDGDFETAWVEGVGGAGLGEWIEFRSNSPQTVREIHIMNGYAKTEDLYHKNNSIKRLQISTDGGVLLEWELSKDPVNMQVIALGSPVKTNSIRLTILEIYTGTSDIEDTCISEIQIF
jgi:VWFA-related protein